MNIVVTEIEVMDGKVKQMLSTLGEVSWGPFQDNELKQALANCEILMVRLGRYIGRDLFRQAPRLRYVVTATTGLDHIDLGAADAAGVKVVSLRDCPEEIQDISATAEHTMGLLLALLRHTPAAAAHVLDGGWDRNRFWGTQLRDKRLGILGYGRIGAIVARYAVAFGMEVVACESVRGRVRPPAKALDFDTLLESSDVVSIHVTATSENRRLLDRAALQRLKRGAVLINTARGAILDEAALAEAVSSGRLAGAAVDVLDGEERGDFRSSPLLACARSGHNVLITPHLGGATRESIARAELAVVRSLASRLGS